MNLPSDLKYAETHEWVKIDGDVAIIGISDYAQEKLGDIVFVELPMLEETVAKGDTNGAIESAKAVADITMPVSGEIIEVNEELEDEPEIINNSPYGKGWILKIKMSDSGEVDSLLSVDKYESILE